MADKQGDVIYIASARNGVGMCAGDSRDELYSLICEDANQRVARVKDYISVEFERHLTEIFVIYKTGSGFKDDVTHFGLYKLRKGEMS